LHSKKAKFLPVAKVFGAKKLEKVLRANPRSGIGFVLRRAKVLLFPAALAFPRRGKGEKLHLFTYGEKQRQRCKGKSKKLQPSNFLPMAFDREPP
jgi:hypothetical protein